MAVNKLFQSEKKQETESDVKYEVTFYSENAAELESFIHDNYAHNTVSADYGRIRHVLFRTEGGIHYCDLEGEHDKDENGLNIVLHSEDGPDRHELTSVVVPVALNRLIHYRVCWKRVTENNDSDSPPPPSGYNIRTSDGAFMDGQIRYAWTETQNAPTENPGEGYKWIQVMDCPTKPGVTHVECYTYQITEEGDHSKLSSAYWVVKKSLHVIANQPILGSMGVIGGNWKCDHASIRPNGKRWTSRLVWTWSIHGWDEDLYPPYLRSV